MNDNVLKELYDVVKDRKTNPQENSYTNYLFEQGIGKILKKVGEESAETIIASLNGDNDELKNEICDLLYHLVVLMNYKELPIEEVFAELDARSKKIGNLKVMKKVDRNT